LETGRLMLLEFCSYLSSMKCLKVFISIFSLVMAYSARGQEPGFPFGKVTYAELGLNTYAPDTSAGAVILNEFGEAHIENGGDYNLIFNHHAKIKILKQHALDVADFEIRLYKRNNLQEKLKLVKASSFNVDNGSLHEVQLAAKNIFREDKTYFDVVKFAVPNVRVGSVIEVEFEIESPFFYKFRTWEFQSEWPKVYSEYWAKIPANYIYNISLIGFLTLSKNEHEVVHECFHSGGEAVADCAFHKFAMKDIPAFRKEDFMTAPSNFMSAINFELSEIKYFNGRTDKITKEWKDAEIELKKDERFGLQLKKGKDIGEQIELLVASEADSLIKAKKVYDFIKGWYLWNGMYGQYSELGIRKAFDTKTGNIGDINLSLIAALRFAELEVEPVILSTRENGLPLEIHPVLSDFNYVIAKVNIGKKSFLLDASDEFYPFGMLPERCLNGKGRAFGDEKSYWVDLKPASKSKTISNLSLKVNNDGRMKGTLFISYLGYEAVRMRRKILSFNNEDEYKKNLKDNQKNFSIDSVRLENLLELEKPVVEKMDIEITSVSNAGGNSFLFNPFLARRWNANPFKSNERQYPVDFGPPFEEVMTINIDYPENFEIVNVPEKNGVSLPDNGGRFILQATNTNGTLKMSYSMMVAKPVFSAQEYHFLKELFNITTQIQNTDLLFKSAN
jgi:hypothetical protein